MLYGIPQVAGNLLLGVAGVTVIGSACANTIAIVMEVVRRALRQGYEYATGASPELDIQGEWKLKAFTPYRSVEDWPTLGLYALQTVIVGTIALYVAHRFMPSFVTSTNSFLHKFIPIQLAPEHNLLTKYAGL